MSRRPEGSKPPDLFYDETEARKYDSSSRMVNIQREITNRAIEMLNLPADRPSYVLDIGCGSGLSGQALEEAGHYWVGCDISSSMLDVANQRENEQGDLLKSDMGHGLPFRPGTFDGVISISAIQWLCYSDSSDQNPMHRLNRFFSTLYGVLKKDARAVLQFYPETSEQAVVIATAASKVGFAGGIVVDYPNSSKAKKYYLCLSFERSYQLPTAMGTTAGSAAGDSGTLTGVPPAESVRVVGRDKRTERRSQKPARPAVKSVDWIKNKKEQRRKHGKEVKSDSKFSGRRRAGGF
mmetsp:Transcript_2388/g.3750  ORF Transcript_2388/g.3750 Transcript_2388/m.3750 type:complete len:294 (-) Transcript_2388:245-1126(-)